MRLQLLMIEQREGSGDAAFWVREGERLIEGRDSNQRLVELRAGLVRHAGVRPVEADAADEEVQQTLRGLHEADYLLALSELEGAEPVVMPDFAPPGLEPDIPDRGPVGAARRGRPPPALPAVARLHGSPRFTYAVCRPPGHHAGPAFH